MRRTIIFLVSIFFIILVSACSKEESISPYEVFDTYMEHWQDEDFSKMYNMLSEEALATYEAEDFIDRYEKIYEDLSIEELQIAYKEPTEEVLKQAIDEGQAIIPFTVEMESLAGPIAFEYEATLTAYDTEEDSSWLLEWDPGFIFPEIKDGGKINIQTTTPVRGEILDRNEMPLALNDLVYEIGIVPEELGDDADSTKKEFGRLLNISVDAIDAKLNENWVQPDLFVPIKKIPKTNDHILKELAALDGMMQREVTGRVYPSGEAAAHLVGHIGQITAEELEEIDSDRYGSSDMIGKRGLEQLFEEQLKGKSGIKITISNEGEEDIILAETSTEDGEDVILTIDANIQDEVFNAFDGEAGTATAIDPKTGETLALVSSPAFDPNELLYGISQSRWDELNDDPQMPFLNRFAATYAPGSVMKPITAAIGLENGSITPEEGIEIEGLTWSNGKGWGDYQVKRVSSSSKPVDLADALTRSDNIYFAMKAVDMGATDFISGLEKFGLGDKMPFKYPIAESTISSSGQLSGEVEVANTSYGQAEIELSALHLATAYTVFLNEGNMLKPTLLLSEEAGEIWQEKLLTAKQASLMQDILRDVVKKGTAKAANQEKLAISGKTGTAELKLSQDSKGHENGWFVGYPTDKQDVLIAMMVEHAEDIGSSSWATEKVTDILLKLK